MRASSLALRASLLSLAIVQVPVAVAQGAAAPAPAAVQPKPLTLERVWGSPDLSGPQLRAVQLSPDGRLVTLLRARANDRQRFDLWAIDTSTGAERMLVDSAKVGTGAELSEAEKMQRERARIGGSRGIVAYDWAADGKSILVPLDGDVYLATLEGNAPAKVTRLTNTPEGELNAVVSPAGRFASYVREGNLYVRDLASGTEQPVTKGASETLHWGEAEFVAQEEMDRRTGYWWSPLDTRIVVARVDESPVGIVTRASIGADGTKVYPQRYPAAGTPNAKVDLFLVNPDGSAMVPVALPPMDDYYIARVNWAKDGRTVYVQRESRDQKKLELFAVDPASGAAKSVLSETAKSWINLSDNFRPLRDGSFLWWSEKSGHGHLYRIRNGKWTQLTKGDWDVRDVVRVDEGRGLVYFTGNMGTPLEQQLYSVSIDRAGVPRQLTASGYWNGAAMDGRASRIIVTRSSTDQPTQVYLADASGQRLRWLSENSLTDPAHPYAPYAAAHAATRFGTIKAADGTDLYYRMQTPKLEPGRKYPVFMIHYGGPGAGRQVTNQWGASGPLNDYLVSQGWIVFAIDNRGTPDRGKAFEDHLYHAMGTVEVADQLAGVDWLKAQDFVDPKAITTYGWSYGGYMSLKLLEKSHGVFAAAVSGAPVTDWTLYDTHYTERYLGDPNARDSAYPASGAIAEATKITDPLLLIHGMSDDNVVFDNSTRLMSVLQNAAVPFETMLYPGQTHRVAGPGVSVHLWQTILAFLNRHVGKSGE